MILICHIILQNYVTKGSGKSPQGKSSSCQVWWSQSLWQWRYNGVKLKGDLARPCGQRVKGTLWGGPIKVSYHPIKFDGHRCSGKGDAFSLSHDLTRPHGQRVM